MAGPGVSWESLLVGVVMTRRIGAAAAVLVLAAGLAGCGDGDKKISALETKVQALETQLGQVRTELKTATDRAAAAEAAAKAVGPQLAKLEGDLKALGDTVKAANERAGTDIDQLKKKLDSTLEKTDADLVGLKNAIDAVSKNVEKIQRDTKPAQ